VAQAAKTRIGGHLVVESLEALGADVVFGLPGIHALAIWEALRSSELQAVGLRTELSAAFAADGYARASGGPAPLILSTGPGALISLAALMEAASSHVPVVAVASQIPADLIGRGRGYLHELRDQRASFAPVVKWTARAGGPEEIPELLAEGWRVAQTPPAGPVFVEIPVDLLNAGTDVPPVEELDYQPPPVPLPANAALNEASGLLREAKKPVVWAGGGVLRGGAWDELAALARRLPAPVVTTFMGKGSFPEDDPLFASSACYDAAVRDFLEDADLVLCVGTELGSETTFDYALRPSRIVQVDAAAERIGATYPAFGLVGDAKATLTALAARLSAEAPAGTAQARAASLRARISRGLEASDYGLEAELLRTIRRALPRKGTHAWDMTILGYDASMYFPAFEPRSFLYPLGSGTLGYAWPAALGARLARRDVPALAVVGDGGIMYGLVELATARQLGIPATLLLVDDGGYGILREYQRSSFGDTTAVDLGQPDFVAAAASFGVPVRETSPDRLGDDLTWALGLEEPSALVLRERLRWIQSDW
jgi:acetolactate synthase I/II/III large subunit